MQGDYGLSDGIFTYDQPDPLGLEKVEAGVGGLQEVVHHITGAKSRLDRTTYAEEHGLDAPTLDWGFLKGLSFWKTLRNKSGTDVARQILANADNADDVVDASNAVMPQLNSDQQDAYITEIAEETATDDKFGGDVVVISKHREGDSSSWTVGKVRGRLNQDSAFDEDTDLDLEPIGVKIELSDAKDELKEAKKDMKAALKRLRKAKSDLAKSLRQWSSRRLGKFFSRKGAETETAELPSTTLSFRATGTLGKDEKLAKTDIGDAFHSVALHFDENQTEAARQISSNFFGHRFGIDAENEENVEIKTNGTRIIGGVVKMETFGLNDTLDHHASSVGAHVDKYVKAGDNVDEGGYVLTVIGDEVELGGSYGAEHEDSTVPKGTKMYHGHMAIGENDGFPAMVLMFRTPEPVTPGSSEKDGTITYKMTGDHLLHQAEPVVMTRKITAKEKRGKHVVIVSTNIETV